ncbi:MAG: ECF transporter S component [Ruminococcus flavefaciens]|nr:ECF transporter S component [Ruminococcus flavefaciens]MCM1229188.1 ECF transporter S component [Ruminococcus flavefaciens]
MKAKVDTKTLVLAGLLAALVVVITNFNIPIGPLSISLTVIPVAIAGIALGPIGGAVIGAVFGICSFLQCFGILGTSGMGVFTLQISPVLTFLQRFVPRVLDGFCVGLIFRLVTKIANEKVSCFVAGFCSAFLNTVFFMSALVILFGNNTGFQETYMGGKGPLIYIISSISVNAVLEMVASTIVAGAVGFALFKAKLIAVPEKKLKNA